MGKFLSCPYRGPVIPDLLTSQKNKVFVCQHPEVASPCSLLSTLSNIVSCSGGCQRWEDSAEKAVSILEGRPKIDPAQWSPPKQVEKPKPVVVASSAIDRCEHLGDVTSKMTKCETCTGTILKVFACSEFGECTVSKKGQNVDHFCSLDCPKYLPVGNTVESAIRYLGPPQKRTAAWLRESAATRSLKTLFDAEARAPERLRPPMSGRGIVVSGGGSYFELAYSCLYNLRKLGCKLPFELWHLGPEEMTDVWREMAMSLGDIKIVDAHTVGPGARILAGWESKVYAIMYSEFGEVLYLDADNLALRDPAYLFDAHEYAATGAIFWPDLDTGKVWIPPYVWNLAGIDPNNRHQPAFETGQILINKGKRWKELCLTMHLNEYSDCWYDFVYGDKDTFKLAWHKLGSPYIMPSQSYWRYPAIIQHDLSKRELFHHCCQGKQHLKNATTIGCLPSEISKNVITARCELSAQFGWPTTRDILQEQSRAGTHNEFLEDNVLKTRALNRFTFFCDSTDQTFTPWLHNDGFWEAWVTLGVIRIIQPGWRCVNVGAHFGYYSLLMASLTGKRVLAFEPNERSCELLKRSAISNNLDIEVRQQAAWNKRETRSLNYDSTNLGAGTIIDSIHFPISSPVSCVALDYEIEECDFLFIDAEGAEPQILEGASRLMESCTTVVEIDSVRPYPEGWLSSLEDKYHMHWINHDGNLDSVTAQQIVSEPEKLWMIHLVKKSK